MMGEPGNEPASRGRHVSVRPSRVRSSQPPGSVTTEVEKSTASRISESGEVKGVCPESAPLAPRNKNFGDVPILSIRAQAKRKMRYRRAWTDTPGSQTVSSRSTALEQPGERRVSWKRKRPSTTYQRKRRTSDEFLSWDRDRFSDETANPRGVKVPTVRRPRKEKH
jgi:hypothetical protein